jgi:hypothetical protein
MAKDSVDESVCCTLSYAPPRPEIASQVLGGQAVTPQCPQVDEEQANAICGDRTGG